MDIILKLSEELGIQKWQAEAAVKLIDEGNTIPLSRRPRVLGRQIPTTTPWLTERHGYDPTLLF